MDTAIRLGGVREGFGKIMKRKTRLLITIPAVCLAILSILLITIPAVFFAVRPGPLIIISAAGLAILAGLLISIPAAYLPIIFALFVLTGWLLKPDSIEPENEDDNVNADSLISSVLNANAWECGPKRKPQKIKAALENETLWISGKGAMRDFYESIVLIEPWHPGNRIDIMKRYWAEDWAPWRFKSMFDSAVTITDIVIKNGVTYIGYLAFVGLPKLNSVTIPASVDSINHEAFNGCSRYYMSDDCDRYNLAAVNVAADNAVYSSVDGVLFNKNKTVLILYPKDKQQETYTIPNSVTAIGQNAFNCVGLKSVIIPRGVTVIEKDAFAYSGLTSVTIPVSAAAIESGAFKECAALTSVTIEEGVTSIGESMFLSCTSLTSIAMPRSVTSIGEYAFACCGGLTSVTTGEGVISIEDGAFYNCIGLTFCTFSNSVKSVGTRIFSKCWNLKSVTALSSVPPGITDETFSNLPPDVRLYVPKGRVNAYRHAWRYVWKDFQRVDEIAVAVDSTALTQAAGDARAADNLQSAARQKSGTNPPTFKSVRIGGQTWTAENINNIVINGRNGCYDHQDTNCSKYGRLYDWETAKIACPAGWHLPSRQEWDTLVAVVGGEKTAGKALKSRNRWGSGNGADSRGFSALPGGFRFTNGVSYDIGNIGDWWTSTEGKNGTAYRKGMSYDGDGVFEDNNDKSMGFSVRCVKDD